jgi:hypothetical protein
MATLQPRQYGYNYCPSGYSGRNCENRNDWYWWGRWVVAGVILLICIVSLVICSITARRRRRRGVQPFYGTGWMATGQKYGAHNQQQGYNMNAYQQPQYPQQNNNQGWTNPPPAYGQQQPQYTGSTFRPSDGYYGDGQQSGVQAPQNTYNRDGFNPPAGPPPGKA